MRLPRRGDHDPHQPAIPRRSRELAFHHIRPMRFRTDGHGETSACALRRLVRFHGRRHDRDFRWQHHATAQRAAPTRSLPRKYVPTWYARHGSTGAWKTTLSAWHRAMSRMKGGAMDCPLHLTCRTWWPARIGCHGRPSQGHRRHILRLSGTNAGVRTEGCQSAE